MRGRRRAAGRAGATVCQGLKDIDGLEPGAGSGRNIDSTSAASVLTSLSALLSMASSSDDCCCCRCLAAHSSAFRAARNANLVLGRRCEPLGIACCEGSPSVGCRAVPIVWLKDPAALRSSVGAGAAILAVLLRAGCAAVGGLAVAALRSSWSASACWIPEACSDAGRVATPRDRRHQKARVMMTSSASLRCGREQLHLPE